MSTADRSTEIVETASHGSGRIVFSIRGQLVERALPSAGTLVLGRGANADVVIDDASVSRRHATLHLGDTIRIEDHASGNGTSVGGRKLLPNVPTLLPPDTVVELGKVIVILRSATPPAPEVRAGDVVVLDPIMLHVHEVVDVAAQSSLNVLLLGETGVGKELIAARVHERSPRANKPFVKVNCAALVESLLEAELFGYERGAFTGAVGAKAGLIESASGGTLFLDEIGEMPLSTQAKLLRVLESGEVTRVGGLKPRPIDVRFVSATHRDVPILVAEGRFRQDLYFRLEGLPIRIPPLRERTREIRALAEVFLAASARGRGATPPTLTARAIERLCEYRWPGNVRELRNVMNRSELFCQDGILDEAGLKFASVGTSRASNDAGAVPAPPAIDPTDPGAVERLARRTRVLQELEAAGWNQTRAAAALGIDRRTLHSWIIELAIPKPGGRRRRPPRLPS